MCEMNLHQVEGGFSLRKDKGPSPLHRLEPRTKLIAIVGFIGLVTGLTSFSLLAAGTIFLLILITFSGLSGRWLAGRLLWVVPLVAGLILLLPIVTPGEPWQQVILGPWAVTLTRQGGQRALLLTLRLTNALLAATLLVGTTPFSELMLALKSLRLPPVLVQLIEFAVRYLSVIGDELRRMYLARKARCFKVGDNLAATYTFYVLGQLIGVLFLRSWQRSERIYQAMLARGFTGSYPAAGATITRPAGRDLAWGFSILGTALGLRLLELGGWTWNILSR